jgi:glycosyltransferase involved in cell wall biosynthesis
MSKRVLHVSQPGDGGVARFVAGLVGDQVERGYDVVVAGPPELEAPVRAAGASRIEWRAGRNPGPAALAETRRLARVVAAARPDIVHLHSSKAGLAGRLTLRGRRTTLFQPHSWSFEALEGPLRRAATVWERQAARWTDVLVCVSEGERERGESAGIRGRFHVVRNGVDLDAFPEVSPAERSAARARLGRRDAPLAVCVARLSRQKGQDVLLRAWPAVRARVADARLVLVGDGPATDELRAQASGGVEFAGAREDVRDWLAAADVVVAPSRWEGMSLAVLEAMACGRSIVATEVPGVHEALGSGSGAVVAVEEEAALADAVAVRLLDPALTAAEGAAGRRRAERHHDLATTHERMAALYDDVLGLPRRERVEPAAS